MTRSSDACWPITTSSAGRQRTCNVVIVRHMAQEEVWTSFKQRWISCWWPSLAPLMDDPKSVAAARCSWESWLPCSEVIRLAPNTAAVRSTPALMMASCFCIVTTMRNSYQRAVYRWWSRSRMRCPPWLSLSVNSTEQSTSRYRPKRVTPCNTVSFGLMRRGVGPRVG